MDTITIIPLEYRDATNTPTTIDLRCVEVGQPLPLSPMSNIYVTGIQNTSGTFDTICPCELPQFISIIHKNKGGLDI